MPDRKAILVLGMHRSGTSAVTRVLNMLGAALPRRIMPAAVANPVGHFEPLDIVDIHDDILRSAGTKWSDWSEFPRSWYESPHREAFVGEIARAVRENYGDAALFVVKDPRMARIVPLWTEALSELGIEPVAVIPYRNPVEVAQSLSTRDRFSLGQGMLMWLRHCLDAEADTRGMPRCFVGYDRLVEESQSTTFRIMEALPVAWPRKTAQTFAKISDFLDPKLHRQKVPLAAIHHPDVNEAVGETFACLARLAEDEADAGARARLDAFRSDLNTTAAMAFAAFEGLAAEQQRLDRHVLELGQRFDQAAAAVEERAEQAIADLVAVAAELQAGQAAADAELDAVGERLRRLAGRVALDALAAREKSSSRSRGAWPRKGPDREQGDEPQRDELRRLVLGSGLFDPDWYRARYGDAPSTAEEALDHYVSVGLERNDDPGPGFDAAWYLEANPDIRQAGVPPFVHYVRSGIAEGRRGRSKRLAARPGGTGPDHEP